MQAQGRPSWFKADFRGEGYLPDEGIADRRLRVQLEGDGADGLFELLRNNERYRTAAALAAVGFTVGDTAGDVEEITR